MLTSFAVRRPLRRALWSVALFSLTSMLVGCGGGGTPETPSPAAAAQIDQPASTSITASADSAAAVTPTEEQKLREALASSGGNEFNAPAQADIKVNSPVVTISAAADAVTAPASSGIASLAVAAQSLAPRAAEAAVTARVFYVDSVNGRDGNAGTANDGTAAGPWQTLSRLQAAALLPGDTVRLVCGSVWNETLAVPTSGTAAAPINIVGYPANCANPPIVDGATVIAPGSWTRHAGNVYKTVLPVDRLLGPNLIANGDLEADLKAWSVWSPNRTASLRQVTACYDGNCMELVSKADATLNLASSDAFSLIQGKSYYARYAVKAPLGVKVRLTLKRSVTPFDSLGHDQVITGTGQWQTFEGTFVAVGGSASGRMDVELLAANSSVQIDRLLIATTTQLAGNGAPGHLTGSTGTFLPAHHPNKGYLVDSPQSQYLKIAADADKVVVDGRSASTYLPTGADLKLPAGAVLTPGTKVRVRSRAWVIEDGEIASVSAGRIGLARPTEYPLSADWGYFLMGKVWMVDSPGEWAFDAATSTLYAWMPNSSAPGSAVTVSRLPVGVNLEARSFVTVSGLEVRNVGVGVNMRRTESVMIRNSNLHDLYGIGVDAVASLQGAVEGNTFLRTGSDAISAAENAGMPATGLRVAYNSIAQSGVVMSGDALLGIPSQSYAAIRSGFRSTVIGNVVADSGYIGIWGMAESQVTENFVRGACSVLDDCGGIYTSGANNLSKISGNLVMHSRGSLWGKPAAAFYTQAQGIYVDELGSGVQVTENTVIDTDNGIQLHVAANNRVENNRLFGNRVSQIWIQETPKGDAGTTRSVYGNSVIGNQIVPTILGSTGFLQTSDLGDTAAFSSFDRNRYFDRVFGRIGSERYPGRTADYNISQWKVASDSRGQARNLDTNAFAASQVQYATYLTTGLSVVPNGNLANGTVGWTTWNATAPFGSLVREACAVGTCARYAAGASSSLLSTPFFSVTKAQWYRVSLDLATGADNQLVQVVVRRGGGGTNGYESLNSSQVRFNGSRQVKRYSFVFASLQSIKANDPLTLDKGARIDFEKILPGQSITVANVEMVPISSVDESVRADVLVNPTSAQALMACPVASTQPALCSKYVRFSDNQSVSWPLLLPARGAEVVYTLDRNMVDSDADGVADSQDRCPATASGQAVDSLGCAAGQVPL